MCMFVSMNDAFDPVCCLLLPGCVTWVCERHIADTQVVHDAQSGQAAVDGVTPLHPDQTGDLLQFEGVLNICADRKG